MRNTFFTINIALLSFITLFILTSSISLAIDTLRVSDFLLSDAKQIEEIDSVISEQEIYYNNNLKFKYIPKYEIETTTYETHEYLTPSQETGYQIITNTETEIKSYGYGPEAQERTYQILKNKNSTSTDEKIITQ